MSWNVNMLGTSENVVKALKEYSEALTDYSKEEYDSVLPHLIGLVENNFVKMDGAKSPMVHLEASGMGYTKNGEQVRREVNVKLTPSLYNLV